MPSSTRGESQPPDIRGGYFSGEFTPSLLNQAVNLLNDRFKVALRPHGISISQWRTLAALANEDGLSLTEIAGFTALGQTTLSRVVTSLVDKGLVITAPREGDGRFLTASLTEAGNTVVAEVWPTAWRISEAALEGWSDEDSARFHDLVQKLVTGLKA